MSPVPSPSPSRRLRRTSLVAAALAIVAAACSGGGSADPTTTSSTTTTTAAPTTTSAPTTTTTEPATTTTEPPPPVFPLTGLPLDDLVAGARPALVVKIDNAPGARPQTGFNEADIVFEEIVNDNLTRFAMVFQSHGSDPVGPVRSGRLQDIDLFGMFHRPLFAWSGGNGTVTAAVRASDLVDLSANRTPAYYRATNRNVPHNLYSNTSKLWTFAPAGAAPPPQQFVYRADGATPAGTASPGVTIKLDAIDVVWTWDATIGQYRRQMEGKPHNDAAGGQITDANVVVLAMNYLPGISGSPDAQTIGSGEAFVFSAGNYVHGTWSRADRLSPFVLTADDGTPILLTPGRTFIELPRVGETTPTPAG
jgi:hypothetical protein